MAIHRNTLKQKNKPFKYSKNKKVSKVKLPSSSEFVRLSRRKVSIDIKNAAKQSRKKLKQLGPKSIFVVSCIGTVNSSEFVNRATEYIRHYPHDPPSSNIALDLDFCWRIGEVVQTPKKASSSSLCTDVYFFSSPRDVNSVISAAAVADIILFLFNGVENDDAFDEKGYELLRILKLQGMPSIIGFNINGLDSKTVRRFFHDELGVDKKFVDMDMFTLIRIISDTRCKQMSWRKDIGYMLAHFHSYDENTKELVLRGYMKNICFTCKNMVHITGIGDFYLNRIAIHGQGELSEVVLVDQLDMADVEEEMEEPVQEEMDDQQLDEMFDNIVIESNENDELDEYFKQISNESKNYEMEIRDVKDRMFPDEVDIPSDILASRRFRKYRALENFSKSDWDPYWDLPVHYSKIHEFESFKSTMNYYNTQYSKRSKTILETIKEITGVDTSEPFIYIYIKDVDIHPIKTNMPFIVSSVMPYERKITVLEMSLNYLPPLKPTEEAPEYKSKSEYEFIVGFRRFVGKPIFSIDKQANLRSKSLYIKQLDTSAVCIASIYAVAVTANLPVLLMKSREVIAYGKVIGPNPNHIILKRIILTGYPIKVHKQKAIVRYMFFNPHDIRWYKPVKLTTKNGLTGQILTSLGTHGYMKCMFNQHISQDDIVMLCLYKRIYPKWYPQTWNNNI